VCKYMKKFWKDNLKIIKFVLILFLFWEVVVTFLGLVAPLTSIPLREGYNYSEMKIVNPKIFWNRANFDGIHYIDISSKGYGIYQQAFFPLYPQLIRQLKPFFGKKDLLTGVFISNFSLLVFMFVFYKLAALDYSEEISKRSLIFYLIFPASFFLGMVYTESLFLMLIVGSFYAARKGKWWLAGILGAFSSYTRIVGVFIFPALIWEWWERSKVKSEKIHSEGIPRREQVKSLLPIFLVPVGLLSYMRFLAKNYQDPLMFLHVQPFFGAGRSGGKIILIYQVFWRYLKMILGTKMDPLYFIVWLEFLTGLGFLLLIFFSFRKKVRLSYLIFAAFAYLLPTFSGTFLSMPRFALSLFPCFMYLGTIKNKLTRVILMAVFSLISILSALLFFRGYWVA